MNNPYIKDKNGQKKDIDITNYQDFIDAGFIECEKCGYAFDPEYFWKHNCEEMEMMPHRAPNEEIKSN